LWDFADGTVRVNAKFALALLLVLSPIFSRSGNPFTQRIDVHVFTSECTIEKQKFIIASPSQARENLR